SIFFWLRSREVTASLVDLLIQIIHRIGVRAERRGDREILNDIKRVTGKYTILYNSAGGAVKSRDGTTNEALYHVVKEQTFKDLDKEFKHTGSAYQEKIHTVIRSSYSSHYRRMIPEILDILEFRSNNDNHRPVINALSIIQAYAGTGQHYFALT